MRKGQKTEYAITTGDWIEHFKSLSEAKKRFAEYIETEPFVELIKKTHAGIIINKTDIDWENWNEYVLKTHGVNIYQ